ncbi:MAG: O-antigen ligase family protein [Zoogloeaceae bacterium]|nr:O-antigen ligase family protein [Zoogloeaceae bacterium]
MRALTSLAGWGLSLLALAALVKTAPAHVGAAIALPAALLLFFRRDGRPMDAVDGLVLAILTWSILRFATQQAGVGEITLIDPAGSLVDWLFPLLFLPFATLLGRNPCRRTAQLWALMLAGFLLGALGFLIRKGPTILWGGERLGFHLDRPLGIGLYAGTFLVLLVATWSRWGRQPSPWRWPARLLGTMGILLLGQMLISAQNRSTFLALLVALVTAALVGCFSARKTSSRPLTSMLAPVALVALLAALALVNGSVIGKRLGAEQAVVTTIDKQGLDAAPASSISARLHLWQFALETFPEAPLLGHGFGSLVDVIQSRLRPQADLPAGERYDHLHNSYLQLLWSQGLIGFGLWAALIGSLILRLIAAARDAPRLRELLPGIAGAMAFVAVWAAFDYRLNHVDTRMFTLLSLLGLYALGTQRPAVT